MSEVSNASDGLWRDTDVDHRQTIVAILCVSILGACGAPNRGLVKFRDPHVETHQSRHQRAVRLAARGRVLYRSGLDGEASETLRKSYGLEPDLHVLLDHANAAERANWFEHAYTAWTKVLDHPVDAALKKRALEESQRLRGLIPTHHASVLVHISPPEATMIFRSEGEQRVVMSDGIIRLPPGDWHVVSSASGFRQELRVIRVRQGRDLTVAVHLRRNKRKARIGVPPTIQRLAQTTAPASKHVQPQDAANSVQVPKSPPKEAASPSKPTKVVVVGRPKPLPAAKDTEIPEPEQDDGSPDDVADNATEPATPEPNPTVAETNSGQEPNPPKPTSKETSKAPAEKSEAPKASAPAPSAPADEDLGQDDAAGENDGDMQDDGAIEDEAPAKVKKPLPPVKLTLVQRLGPLITAGTGVIALGVGGILGKTAENWVKQANALPSTRSDYQSQLKFYSDGAKSRALGATAAIIGGGVLAAAGTVWWVLSLRAAQRTAWLPSNVGMTDRKWSLSWTF